MIRFVLFLFSCICILSCVKDRVPKDVLRAGEMQQILWDMMRADELVNVEAEKDTGLDRKKRSAELYSQVYRIHHSSQEAFKRSIRFYQRRPDLFQPILDSVKAMSERVAATPWITTPAEATQSPRTHKKPDTVKRKKINPI